jgi:L,D-peptidoglycan transpeptidase YkuD (ErfK/YbiS/YcfS/YnhG family)/uncharacterized protein YceK
MRRQLLWVIVPLVAALGLAGCSSTPKRDAAASAPASSTRATTAESSSSALPTPTTTAPTPTASAAAVGRAAAPVTTAAPAAPAAPVPQALPLSYSPGAATQVITVVASSTASTTATLQRWTRSGTGWLPFGAAVTAHLGSAGLTLHPSESLSATPIGSFTLTQAFGHDANPGTQLPYLQTTPDDWWISQPGPLYNTHQRCASACAFTQGDPNEHLYYETPFYNYAVVIDYNTGTVTQGAGSAFFLHVTDGNPTAGCVSVPQASEIAILDWLDPAAAPRILIGTA